MFINFIDTFLLVYFMEGGKMWRSIVSLMMISLLTLTSATLYSPADEPSDNFVSKYDSSRQAQQGIEEILPRLCSIDPFFTENRGQLGLDAGLFHAYGSDTQVSFDEGGVTYYVQRNGSIVQYSVEFDGPNEIVPIGVGLLDHRTNFIVGCDEKEWTTGVRNYEEVVYNGVWDGIDVRYYFEEGTLKYDVMVGPGAEISLVRFNYYGVEGLDVDPVSGDLHIMTHLGHIVDSAPYTFQDGGIQGRCEVPSQYIIGPGLSLTYDIEVYDRNEGLVIDPGIQYSTFIGGNGSDELSTLAMDSSGGYYIGGVTDSTDIIGTSGVIDQYYGLGKVIIIGLDSNLETIRFITYYGANASLAQAYPTAINQMTVRPDGNILFSGSTKVSGFPTTTDAYMPNDPDPLDRDGYYGVLNKDGSELIYGSYFGGDYVDHIVYHHLSDDGSLFLFGDTESDDLYTSNGSIGRTLNGRSDIYIAKFNSTYNGIIASSYFGGSGKEGIGYNHPFVVDTSSNIHIIGWTTSSDLGTTPNAVCATYHPSLEDSFVLKMNGNMTEMSYLSYFGGTGDDRAHSIFLESDGSMILVGRTSSEDLNVTNDAWSTSNYGDRDCFITLIGLKSPQPIYSTYLGGSGDDYCTGALFNETSQSVTIVGWTQSEDLPSTNGCYNRKFTGGTRDLFLIEFSITQSTVLYCTYIGGGLSNTEERTPTTPESVVSTDGSLTVVGRTNADDFPTTSGAYCRTYNGGEYDSFILNIDLRPVAPPPVPTLIAKGDDDLVKLNWSSSPSEAYVLEGYNVYRGTDEGSIRLFRSNVKDEYYLDTDVENGNAYFYQVAAVNSAGESGLSNLVQVVPMGLPSPPRDFLVDTGNGTVNITWDTPSDLGGGTLLGYYLYRGPDEGNMSVIHQPSADELRHVDTDVEVGEVWFYKLVASNERGKGLFTTTLNVTVTSPPTAPLDFDVTAGPGKVLLSWEAPASYGGTVLLGYRVLRGSHADMMETIATILPDSYEYEDKEVINGSTYHYRIQAYSSVGSGRLSEVIPATPYGPPGNPIIDNIEFGDGQVWIEWTPPKNTGARPIIGYNIHLGSSPETLSLAKSIDVSTSDFLTGLENEVRVYIAVTALNEVGEGSPSGIVSGTPYRRPDTPTGPISTLMPGDGIHVSWGPPTDVNGSGVLLYHLYKGLNDEDLELFKVFEGGFEHLDEDVEMGRSYFYAVSAVNPLGVEGETSSPISRMYPDVPGRVGAFELKDGDGEVGLSWEVPEDDGGSPILGYVILRSVEEQDFRLVDTIGLNVSYTDSVVNGQGYRYTITAFNEMGEGETSEIRVAHPRPVPNAPYELSYVIEDGIVALSWKAPIGSSTDVTGYHILRAKGDDEPIHVATIGNVLRYEDDDVVMGQRYRYRIVATSDVGDSAPSEVIEVEVTSAIPWTLIIVGLLIVAVVFSVYYLRFRKRIE